MNTIKFNSKEAFMDALEGRRKFWRDYDLEQARTHKAAEQAWLKTAREKMRTALKLAHIISLLQGIYYPQATP